MMFSLPVPTRSAPGLVCFSPPRPPSGLCFGGAECKRKLQEESAWNCLTCRHRASVPVWLLNFLFSSPKRSTPILGPEKSWDSSCTVFYEEDLCSSAPPHPCCSLDTLQALCCLCSWWICNAEQQHLGHIFMLFIWWLPPFFLLIYNTHSECMDIKSESAERLYNPAWEGNCNWSDETNESKRQQMRPKPNFL